MKKTAFFALVFPIVALISVLIFSAQIKATSDDVVYTQETLYGDISATDGLKISTNSSMNLLYWHSDILPDGSSETEHIVCTERPDYTHDYGHTGVNFHTLPNGMTTSSDQLEFTMHGAEGLTLAYQELLDETEAGNESEKNIYLQDYMDFYPVSIEFDFVGLQLYEFDYRIEERLIEEQPDLISALQASEKLAEYLKIPILEGENLNINIRKNLNGDISGHGLGTNGDFYHAYTQSIVTDDACYFIFNSKTQDGRVIDISHLSLGYGVYKFPLSLGESRVTELHIDELEVIYEIDPKIDTTSLLISPDESKLYLISIENSVYTVKVIDSKTGELVQTLELYSNVEGFNHIEYFGEDFFTVVFTSSNSNELAVVSMEADGMLIHEFSTEYDGENFIFPHNNCNMAFNGEQLAAIGKDWFEYDNVNQCDFLISTFDKNGLTYYGNYSSGLSRKVAIPDTYYINTPYPNNYGEGFILEWE